MKPGGGRRWEGGDDRGAEKPGGGAILAVVELVDVARADRSVVNPGGAPFLGGERDVVGDVLALGGGLFTLGSILSLSEPLGPSSFLSSLYTGSLSVEL